MASLADLTANGHTTIEHVATGVARSETWLNNAQAPSEQSSPPFLSPKRQRRPKGRRVVASG